MAHTITEYISAQTGRLNRYGFSVQGTAIIHVNGERIAQINENTSSIIVTKFKYLEQIKSLVEGFNFPYNNTIKVKREPK